MLIFKDRIDAGQKLAEKLTKYKTNSQAIIIGLPRGGAMIAAVCAQELQISFDLIAVRKVGMPHNPECALGAVGYDGTRMIDQKLAQLDHLEQEDLEKLIKDQEQEAQRRMKIYRPGHSSLDLQNQIAIIVDDGIATGSTMEVAIMVARKLHAHKIVVAVPVLPANTLEKFENLTDELVYLQAPEYFAAVGAFYQDFDQVEDKQVIELMTKSYSVPK